MNEWKYNGDVNLECGGYYWQESGCDDHVYCIDVVPMSDCGGPDNLFLIETGSIYLGNENTIASALECCGLSEPVSRAALVDAVKAYRGQESDTSYFVAIGKIDNGFDIYCGFHMPEIDVQLRGNAKLANYIRREHLAC